MENNSLNKNFRAPGSDEINENNDTLIEFKFSNFQNKKVFSEKLGKEVYLIIEKYQIDPNTSEKKKYYKFYSTLKEVKDLFEKKIEFYLVNKEFLEKNRIEQKEYIGKEVIFYESENKKCFIFPKEKNTNNILEIIEFKNLDNNDSLEEIEEKQTLSTQNTKKEETYVENKEIILKKSILLYAFEKEFIQLMKSPIKDEYDVNEYYLINKNWINIYKTEYYHNYICPHLNSVKKQNNKSLSYKGYLINIESIINYIKSTQDFQSYLNEIEKSMNKDINILSKEGNFIPKFNEQKINENGKVQYPIEFILVPEKLFDLFYKGIKASKYKKDDYKYNILIGDNVLFIQNKKHNNIFYSYL